MKFGVIIYFLIIVTLVSAHPGAVDEKGGHVNRKTGEYHYHKKNLTESKSEELTGKVISVSDGDTITIFKDNTQYKIRLNGIDCPEKSQAYGAKAKEFTSELCYGKTVTAIIKEKDRYSRYVAEIILENGDSLNQELVKNGLAWHYKQYSNDSVLSELEKAAKSQKIGLWAEENPLPPWEYRR